MRPLGNSGLPTGYKRLEYIENSAVGAYINTGLPFATGYIRARISSQVDQDPNDAEYFTSVFHYVTGIIHPEYKGVDKSKNFLFYQETPDILTVEATGINSNNKWYFRHNVPAVATVIIDTENGYAEVDGVRRSCTPFVLEETVAALPIFARQAWYALTDLRYHAASNYTRVNSFEVTAKANGNIRRGNFVPALNPSGVPGMFDTVAKTFKKSATSTQFTAGMTLRQVRDMNLPVPGTVNTLSLSIPCEVYNDSEAWGAIEAAQQKGWTFTFYWTDVVAYLTPQLNAIVGSGNYTISYTYQTSKLRLVFALSLTEEQVDEVENLLESVLSSSIVVDMKWSNGLPVMAEYSPLEYVDCLKMITHDSVITTNALDVDADVMFVTEGTGTAGGYSFIHSTAVDTAYGNGRLVYTVRNWGSASYRMEMVNNSMNRDFFPTSPYESPLNIIAGQTIAFNPPSNRNARLNYHFHDCGYDVDGKFYQYEPSEKLTDINWGKMRVAFNNAEGQYLYWRIWSLKVRQNGVLTADLVPCVRKADGSPGFWCNVYKKFYDQSPIMTTELDLEEDDDNGVYYLTEEEIAALGLNEVEPPTELPAES